MPLAGQYGRRMAARRTSRLSGCGHLALRGEQIYQRPGQHKWFCQDCALAQARELIAAAQAGPPRTCPNREQVTG